MKTPTTISILALASIVTLGCGSGLEYRHDAHDDAPFDRYRTLSLMRASDVPQFTRTSLNDEQRAAALSAGEAALRDKGWELVDDADSADLVLTAGVGRRIRVEERIEGMPTMRFSTYEVDIQEGTIVLDAFDRRSGEHVWHGQVIGAGDPPAPPERVAEAVRLLLSEFPAAGTGEALPAQTSGGETDAETETDSNSDSDSDSES
jgi:hypothetical protein